MPKPMIRATLAIAVLGVAQIGSQALAAGDADVVAAVARPAAAGQFSFDVTVRSRDTGWDRYADRIEVLGPDGAVLGIRDLDHPHDDEQPFTRSTAALPVPTGLKSVTVRARFKPTGYGGAVATVTLPGR